MKSDNRYIRNDKAVKKSTIFGQKIRKIMLLVIILAGVLAGALIATKTICSKENNADEFQASIAQKILRFHILANSDTPEDQQLKLVVRDAVGQYVEILLQNAHSREETEEIINENMDDIVAIANSVIEKNGYNYEASARLLDTEFPVKKYGKYTFPAGTYRALQIKIGKARGQNWWCVLYPNMCFQGALYKVDDAEQTSPNNGEENLQELLSPEEYQSVIDSGEFQIKFKILEYLPFTR